MSAPTDPVMHRDRARAMQRHLVAILVASLASLTALSPRLAVAASPAR